MEGVFVSTVKIMLGHCLVTWIWFKLFSIKYLHLFTLGAGVLSVLPIVSPWMLALLPVYNVYARTTSGGLLVMLVFFVVYFLVINYIDAFLYEEHVRVPSFVFGLSVALGVYSFGINGFIYGPLLVCILRITYDIFKDNGT